MHNGLDVCLCKLTAIVWLDVDRRFGRRSVFYERTLLGLGNVHPRFAHRTDLANGLLQVALQLGTH